MTEPHPQYMAGANQALEDVGKVIKAADYLTDEQKARLGWTVMLEVVLGASPTACALADDRAANDVLPHNVEPVVLESVAEKAEHLRKIVAGTVTLAPNLGREKVEAVDVAKCRVNLRERFEALDRALEHVQLTKAVKEAKAGRED